ncbi:unnamed protein product, partial [Effrenium voratum]
RDGCGSSLASLLPAGPADLAPRMVTHHWGNRFVDLVAAVVADALGLNHFDTLAQNLSEDHAGRRSEVNKLKEKLWNRGLGDQPYWICAVCINQHSSICNNPRSFCDTVTGQPVPCCECDTPKILNDQYLQCELNKFDDMMMHLYYVHGSAFVQVLAIDRDFEIFSRAWCLAEMVQADACRMDQHVLLHSPEALEKNSARLVSIRVQDCSATRPEDKEAILSNIGGAREQEQFNDRLRDLLLGAKGLLAKWLDGQTNLQGIGAVAARVKAETRAHEDEDSEEESLGGLPLERTLSAAHAWAQAAFEAATKERKLALQTAFNDAGKRVGLNEFAGVLALKKQTVTAKQLSDALIATDELVAGLVALNQKEEVWQGIPGQDVLIHQVPQGKMDFGWNIAMDGIPLFLSTGHGFGEAEVYHMLKIYYGSLKLTKHLPSFEGFHVDRIIVYPLLLHSLKNYSTLKWESPPASISAAKKKETALRALLKRLQQDQFLGHGGYRVEARLSGHGDPKEWLQQFMAWVLQREYFEAKVQIKVVSLEEYLATAARAVNQWGSMLNRDGRLQLSTGAVMAMDLLKFLRLKFLMRLKLLQQPHRQAQLVQMLLPCGWNPKLGRADAVLTTAGVIAAQARRGETRDLTDTTTSAFFRVRSSSNTERKDLVLAGLADTTSSSPWRIRSEDSMSRKEWLVRKPEDEECLSPASPMRCLQ